MTAPVETTRKKSAAFWLALVGIVVLMPVLAGCSFANKDDDDFSYVEPEPAPKLYDEALLAYNTGRYKIAADKFLLVDKEHPYSVWAKKAGLMIAASKYREGDYETAAAAGKRYIGLNPTSEEAPYAQYIVAMSYYNQIGRVERDQQSTIQAMQEFQELVRLYPESEYVVDSKKKIAITRDQLAGKQMEVGRYYLEKRNHTAAINRFKKVVESYQDTSHIEESLYRLTESYLALGVFSEAQTAAAVLGHNYPESTWYKNAFTLLESGGLSPAENRGSWLSRAFQGVTSL